MDEVPDVGVDVDVDVGADIVDMEEGLLPAEDVAGGGGCWRCSGDMHMASTGGWGCTCARGGG